MKTISPSLLASDFVNIEQEIRKLERIGIQRLHLDVMDGHFVSNLTFGPVMIKAIRNITNCHLEAHLMIENPKKTLNQYIDAGADTIIIHIEASDNAKRDLIHIRKNGIRAGLALNPNTNIKSITSLLDYLDYVLIMSVFPGKGGQLFIPETLDKMIEMDQLRFQRDIMIGVDGGVNLDTINNIFSTNIDIGIVGSGLFNSDDMENRLKDLMIA